MRAGKGFRGSARRASLLPLRYGIGPERLRSRLRSMAEVLARWETTPTVPVTTSALERHPALAEDLRRVDPAIHGYRHTRYSALRETEQARDLDEAMASFRRHGLPAHGFRAPYLAANETTRTLLKARGFAYDSSACALSLPQGHPAAPSVLRLAKARYGPVPEGPRGVQTDGGFVELPVALPDDEILIDGLGIENPEELTRIFRAMLEPCLRSGGLLVLQVHPERFHLCAAAVEGLLRSSRDKGAWMAPLSEIADHARNAPRGGWPGGQSMAVAVTGDLDAVSLLDFVHRLWGG